MRKLTAIFLTAIMLSVAAPVAIGQPAPSPAMEAPAMNVPAAVDTAPMTSVPEPKAPEKKPDTPVYKQPGFWVGIGGTVLGIVLTILVAFGVLQKKHFQYLKDKDIIKIADKVVSGIEGYATSSSAKWDDILAMVLRAVVDRVGELTEEQTELVKKVVEDRKKQIEAKENMAADEKPAKDAG
jgi:hypothetical protein